MSRQLGASPACLKYNCKLESIYWKYRYTKLIFGGALLNLAMTAAEQMMKAFSAEVSGIGMNATFYSAYPQHTGRLEVPQLAFVKQILLV